MIEDLLAFIKSRRSTRQFRADPVPADLLEAVVEAGRYAPSGGNNQTCHFLVVQKPEQMKELSALVLERIALKELRPDTYKSLASAITRARRGEYCFHHGAPVLICVANREGYGNNMADCACANENMMLMAHSLGLGSCYINQLKWLNDDPVVTAYLTKLGLLPGERVYCALALGYADTPDGKPLSSPLPRTGNQVTYC